MLYTHREEPMTARLVLADDDQDVLDALSAVVQADERFTVVASVGSGDAAQVAVRQQSVDAVVLDARMPGGGADAARALLAFRPALCLVVLSARLESALVDELLQLGVRGVLHKGRVGGHLPSLLARCVDGEVVVLL